MGQLFATANQLHSAAIHLLRRAAATDAGMNLDGPRASLLSILTFAGPQTMSRLAGLERVTPAAITKLVTALERDGLVRRVRDDGDRRMVRVEATAMGKARLEAGRNQRVLLISGLLKQLSKEDRDTVARAAHILHELLGDEHGRASLG
ncbi:MarR family winged helix-turn-helix transcriptional regulator [Allorhizocola rhizosphaerae]|uniref:MarR family winged helix-turn-helix transcriptional regulator n=1 Tax=Allorhizocola rhizosphaerae TaxID=1872709 RepID=UPI000E3D1CB5|nr:MarR family transcriptional regulator [Allorhizocola rhizosphaerae]